MKRFYFSLLALALVAALTTAGSLALFRGTASNPSNTFTTGTLGLATTATAEFTMTNMAPGDLLTDTWVLTYSGSLDGFVAVDLAGNGNLFSCEANMFQVVVSDPNATMATSIKQGFLSQQDVQLTDDAGQWVFQDGDKATITVTPDFNRNATEACAGKSATITLAAHAVQAKNNTKADGHTPTNW